MSAVDNNPVPWSTLPVRAFLTRHPLTAVVAGILLTHILLAVLAPVVSPYPPDKMDFLAVMQPPSLDHWFGTDRYGRDVFSRVVHGGQITLMFGVGAVALCFLIGLPAGLAAAYFGGIIDQIVMRIMDVAMSFPTLLLGLLILIIAGADLTNLVIAVGLVYSPRTTRVVRSAALTLRHAPFVEAAEARGEGALYIMAREMLPAAWGPIIVELCIRAGYAILLGASFNYLGLGVQPPDADWGALVYEARGQMLVAPWVVLFPILFISSLVASLHLLGDAIDAGLGGRRHD